jgi:tRNA G10  N-methylase Trm11
MGETFMKHFAVFGIHPRLSLAEWMAIKRDMAKPPVFIERAAIFDDPDWDGEALMNRIGGTTKLGDIILETKIQQLTTELLADAILNIQRDAKIVFGFTVLGGAPLLRKRVERLPLGLKRELKARGRSVRWVTSKDGQSLSPAAVAKLDLTKSGYDLVLLIQNDSVRVGLTTHVQDADAWSLRDYGRPIRDDKNGMLPPKLARIIVNLAHVPEGGTVIDPFCGSGTMLMEAALAEKTAKIFGSDIDPQQISATEKNLKWLYAKNILTADDQKRINAFTADARHLEGHFSNGQIDRIATEGFLGPPLRGNESRDALEKTARQISDLWRETLSSIYPLLADHGIIVCVWPSFKNDKGSAQVDLSKDPDVLRQYSLLNTEPLIYERPGQRVSRRIIILKKLST